MNAPRIRVLLVDDHAVVREGYRRLLEREPGIEVAGEAATADEACELAARLDPDVIVMDIALPGPSGIEATRRILERRPGLRVLIFSMYEDEIFRSRARAVGARAYLSKTSSPEQLVRAVYAVARDEPFESPAPSAPRVPPGSATRGREAPTVALTARERDVLRLLAQGETVRSIGEKLGLSEKTVANHQSALREKLGVKNSVQLARVAAQLGLITGSDFF
jgi:two-component system, NarL family, invasion response regulator UvrY